jgi:peptidoglycan/LPS O-acetylase OafA/YrhL
MNRISSLHALRGLAALYVAVGHTYWFAFDGRAQERFLGSNLFHIYPGLAPGFPLYQYSMSGALPVCAFFLLSGFVLEGSLKKLSPLRFLLTRAFRIYPTYLLALPAYFLLVWLVAGKSPSLGQFLGEASLIHRPFVMNVGWTLFYEVRYDALIGAIFFFTKTSLRPWIILLLFVFSGAVTLFWLSFMAIGAVSARVLERRNEGGTAIELAELPVFIAAWIFFAIFYYKGIKGVPPHEIYTALAIFFAALVLRNKNFDIQPLRFAGDISYPLYCIHLPICVAAHYFLARLMPINALVPISLAASIGVAWLVHKYVEAPWIERGKRFSSRVPAMRAFWRPVRPEAAKGDVGSS